MRLIDADDLKEQFAWSEVCRLSIKEITQIINNAPTIAFVMKNNTHAEIVTPDDIKKLDNTDSFDYYHLDQLSNPECYVKPRYEDLSVNSCGKCRHLIFKDYKSMKGFCDLCRIDRNFEDCCAHEEEMS